LYPKFFLFPSYISSTYNARFINNFFVIYVRYVHVKKKSNKMLRELVSLWTKILGFLFVPNRNYTSVFKMGSIAYGLVAKMRPSKVMSIK
jgi:hypothetical protein